MIRSILSGMALSLITFSTALADCGEAPTPSFTIPSGETASAGEIRTIRDDVLKYSEKVDAYLTCMDQQGLKLLPWMDQEQRARREEDLTSLHNKRRDIQVALNDAIRTYRTRQQSS